MLAFGFLCQRALHNACIRMKTWQIDDECDNTNTLSHSSRTRVLRCTQISLSRFFVCMRVRALAFRNIFNFSLIFLRAWNKNRNRVVGDQMPSRGEPRRQTNGAVLTCRKAWGGRRSPFVSRTHYVINSISSPIFDACRQILLHFEHKLCAAWIRITDCSRVAFTLIL